MSWLRRFFIFIRLLYGRVKEIDERLEAAEKRLYALEQTQERMLKAYRSDLI